MLVLIPTQEDEEIHSLMESIKGKISDCRIDDRPNSVNARIRDNLEEGHLVSVIGKHEAKEESISIGAGVHK